MSELKNPDINLVSALEALLFVAVEPVLPSQLATVLEMTTDDVEKGLKELEERKNGSGVRLQRFAGRVQLTTAPEMAAEIERFLGLESTSHLTHAAVEALAIIAFRQPVTRPYVEGIRGVNSDGVIKSLLGKGLIQETGRAEGPGRPIFYGTTPDFLQYFGLSSLSELPELNLPDLQNDNNHDDALKG